MTQHLVRTKSDHTGRSTNKLAGTRTKEVLGLPKDVGYSVPLPTHLLASPAITVLSQTSLRVLLALMHEFGIHGGQSNGSLILPYAALAANGVAKSTIHDAIAQLEALGLIEVTKGGRSYGCVRRPNTYRLTWLGTPDLARPTNEWRRVSTRDEAKALIEAAKEGCALQRANRLKRNSPLRSAVTGSS